FKYFNENLDSYLWPYIVKQDLEKQHQQQMNLSKEIFDLFELNKNNLSNIDYKQLNTLLTQWNDLLNQHLLLEERSIVHLWLNLTPIQYEKYRTYLSFK